MGHENPIEPGTDSVLTDRAGFCRLARDARSFEASYGDDPAQRIDIYPSPAPNGTVLAFIHGGGWDSGYKERFAFMAQAVTRTGVTFASIGYRLAPAHRFPGGFDDCARAVAWIHRHAEDYGGRPTRVFVGGHSAGAHYASLLAVRRDWQAALGVSTDVIRGCLPISGSYDLTEFGGLAERPVVLEPEADARAASPIHSIHGMPPPFFLAHGSRDRRHVIDQSERMQTALGGAGGEAIRAILPARDHCTSRDAAGDIGGPWVTPALGWMEDH